MKKRTKIAVGAAVVALPLLIGAVACACWQNSGPVYKGKEVRDYLDHALIVQSGPQPHFIRGWYRDSEFELAFEYFGTNAIPYVRADLRARDSWGRRLLLWVKIRAPWLRIRVSSAYDAHLAALYAYKDVLANGYWGEEKEACAPEVRALLNDPDYLTRTWAAQTIDEMAVTRVQKRFPRR